MGGARSKAGVVDVGRFRVLKRLAAALSVSMPVLSLASQRLLQLSIFRLCCHSCRRATFYSFCLVEALFYQHVRHNED